MVAKKRVNWNAWLIENRPDLAEDLGVLPVGGQKQKTGNKFNAKRVVIDGVTFDSKKEGERYRVLKTLRNHADPAQKVTKIKRQVPYLVEVNGQKICNYKLDFEVTYGDGRVEYEDVKGLRKGSAYQVFRLKKKLVEAIYGIKIIEI